MKQFITAIVVLMFSVPAFATVYGIIGGVIIKPDSGPAATITFDGNEMFFILDDCEKARKAYVVAPVLQAHTITGTTAFPAYTAWEEVKALKIDATKCSPVTPTIQ